MKVAHLSEPAEERVVFRDGLGVRERRETSAGEVVEWFHLDPAFAAAEAPLRERVARLTKLQHAKFARILSLEPAPKGRGPILVSSHVPGTRLSEVLEMAGHGLLTFEPGAGIQVAREALSALTVLHDSRNVAHGALAPERIVLTAAGGRVVVVEHVLSQAIDRLQRQRHQLWREWRIPTPPAAGPVRLDMQTDLAQAGLLALAVLLGRPVDEEEYPHRLRGLLPLVQDRLVRSPAKSIAGDVVAWLERLAPVDSRRAFKTVKEAQQHLEGLLSGGAAALGASPARVKGVMAAVAAINVAPVSVAADPPPSTPLPVEVVTSPQVDETTDFVVAAASPETEADADIDIEALLRLEAELEGDAPAVEPVVAFERPKATRRGAAKIASPSVPAPEPAVASHPEAAAEPEPISESAALPTGAAAGDGAALDAISQERVDLERQFAELVATVAPADDEPVHLIPKTPPSSEPLVDARVQWSSMPAEDIVDRTGHTVLASVSDPGDLTPISQEMAPGPFSDVTAAAEEIVGAVEVAPEPQVADDADVALLEQSVTATSEAASIGALPEPAQAIDHAIPSEWWREALPWRNAGASDVTDARGDDDATAQIPAADAVEQQAENEPSHAAAAPERGIGAEFGYLEFDDSAPAADGGVASTAADVAPIVDAQEIATAIEDVPDDVVSEPASPVGAPDAVPPLDATEPDDVAMPTVAADETYATWTLPVAAAAESDTAVEGAEAHDDVALTVTAAFVDAADVVGEAIESTAPGVDEPVEATQILEPVANEPAANADSGDARCWFAAALRGADDAVVAESPSLADPSADSDVNPLGGQATEPGGAIGLFADLQPIGMRDDIEEEASSTESPFGVPHADAAPLTAAASLLSRDVDEAIAPDWRHALLGDRPEDAAFEVEGPAASTEAFADRSSAGVTWGDFDLPLVLGGDPTLAEFADQPTFESGLPDDAVAELVATVVDADTTQAVDDAALAVAVFETTLVDESVEPVEPVEPIDSVESVESVDSVEPAALDLEPVTDEIPAVDTEPAVDEEPPVVAAPDAEAAVGVAQEVPVEPAEAEVEPLIAEVTTVAAAVEPATDGAGVVPEVVVVDEGADADVLSELPSEAAVADVGPDVGVVAPTAAAAAAASKRKRKRSRRKKGPVPAVVQAPAAVIAPAPVAPPVVVVPVSHAEEPQTIVEQPPVDDVLAVPAARASLLEREVPTWTPPADLNVARLSSVRASAPHGITRESDGELPQGSTPPLMASTEALAAASRPPRVVSEAISAPTTVAPTTPISPVETWGAPAAVAAGDAYRPHEQEIRAVGMPDLEEIASRSGRTPVTSMADHIGPVSGGQASRPFPHDHWSTASGAEPASGMGWRRLIAASILIALFNGAAFAAWWWVQPGARGTLVVQTSKSGIEVLLDDKVVGRTPFREEVAPGRHKLKLRQGTNVREMPVEISVGVVTTQAINWPSLAGGRGNLQVSSNPAGAEVFINGRSRGQAPVLLEDLPAGDQSLMLRSDAGTVTVSATVVPDETTPVEVKIFAGWILVDAPVEVNLLLNGRDKIGSSMDGQILLPPGLHRVQAVNDSLGIRQWFNVNVEPGAVRRVPFTVAPGTLTLNEEAEIFVDGTSVGTTPGTVRIQPGTHEILIRPASGVERRQALTVRSMQHIEF